MKVNIIKEVERVLKQEKKIDQFRNSFLRTKKSLKRNNSKEIIFLEGENSGLKK